MELRIESFTNSGNHLKWLPQTLKKMDAHGNSITERNAKKKVYYDRMFKSLTDTRSVDVLVPESTKSLRKKKTTLRKITLDDILNALAGENRRTFEAKMNGLEKELERILTPSKEGLQNLHNTGRSVVQGQYLVREALKAFEKSLRNQFDPEVAGSNMLYEKLLSVYGEHWYIKLECYLVQEYVRKLEDELGLKRFDSILRDYLFKPLQQDLQLWINENYDEHLDIALRGEPVKIEIKYDKNGYGSVVEAEITHPKEYVQYSTPTMGIRDLDDMISHYNYQGRPIGSGEGSLNSMVQRQNPPPSSRILDHPLGFQKLDEPIKTKVGIIKPKNTKNTKNNIFKMTVYEAPDLDNDAKEVSTESEIERVTSEEVGQVVPSSSIAHVVPIHDQYLNQFRRTIGGMAHFKNTLHGHYRENNN